MNELKKNRVLLAVSGGIAAYKACEIVRRLREADCAVTVIMTENATRFVGALSFEALSGNRVYTHEFDPSVPSEITHIGLGRDADLLLVAPATADLMARLAAGMANDLVTTAALAYAGPQIICPAMNQRMWANAATQSNLSTLRVRGWQIIEPEEGDLACGETGPGRLADPALIVAAALRALRAQPRWNNRRVLISAGPTWEPIDSVRHLSNRSTGQMGYALARAAWLRGAEVTLVSGPSQLAPPPGVKRVSVETAAEMLTALEADFPRADLTLMTAAVSDFRPAQSSPRKLHKKATARALELVENPDLIATLSAKKRKGQIVCGFAAENREEIDISGLEKLQNKKLDAIFANAVDESFGKPTNAGMLIYRGGRSIAFSTADKTVLAEQLLEELASEFFTGESDGK